MREHGMQRENAFAALQNSYVEACSTVEFLAEKAIRWGFWDPDDFGKRLSELYLRLKQGPVRAVIMGQTSSGKSTLINALVGSIIAPESADACSPIPICFMGDKKHIDVTHITYFDKQDQKLPKEEYANQKSLLQWHHDSGTLAQDNGTRPFVHTAGATFPQLVTLIDSPGLNANDTDSDKLYALFDKPSYTAADESDLPELVLYVSTAGGNLSEEEMKSLQLLLDKGVDPHRIFVVHNELCADLEHLKPDEFERADDAARNGLAESFRALLPPETPDIFAMDMNDSSAIFDAFLGAGAGGDPFAAGEDDAYAHIVSLNALFARVFYAGGYDPMANLITGATEGQFKQLLEARNNPKQDRVIELSAAWRQCGHADYQPLLHLRDVINDQALKLAETADLKAALRAVSRLGQELYEKRFREVAGDIECTRAFIREWLSRLDDLRNQLRDAHSGFPGKIEEWHGEYAARLNGMLRETGEKLDQKIRSMAEMLSKARTETVFSTFGRGFWDGATGGSRFGRGGGLLGGIVVGVVMAVTKNALEEKFNTLLKENMPFAVSKDGAAQDQQLLQAYQTPESEQDICAALEIICEEMLRDINQNHLKPDETSQTKLREMLDAYGESLTAKLKEKANEVKGYLSSFCQSLDAEAQGKNRALIDDLMRSEKFSMAVSAQSEDQLSAKLPTKLLECRGEVISRYRVEMDHPIRKPEHMGNQIPLFYAGLKEEIREKSVDIRSFYKLVFRRVACPVLEEAAKKSIGTFDAEKISAQMDKLLQAAQDHAGKALTPIILSGFGLINECRYALNQAMEQCRGAEENEELKCLAGKLARNDQYLSESAALVY